jgi:hypothetical protein
MRLQKIIAHVHGARSWMPNVMAVEIDIHRS